MSLFEFGFSLFSLLLGLCLAEIFGGFGRVFEHRGAVQVGWTTPLLALVVLCDLLTIWTTLWDERSLLPINPLSVFGGAMFAGVYYLASYIVFPRTLSNGTDLDQHMLKIRRLVLGISLLANVALGFLLLALGQSRIDEIAVTLALFIPAYAVAMFAQGKRAIAIALGVLVAINLTGAITQTVFS